MAHVGNHVAVVGAGWAGLAAAVTLAGHGVRVSVYEASRSVGGRARRVTLGGIELDNGQHILIGAYRDALALMRQVGVEPDDLLQRLPLELRYADGFHLRAPRAPYPLNLLWALLAANGLTAQERWRAIQFLRSVKADRPELVPDRAVARWLDEHRQNGVLRTHLWEPLCVSALNTPPEIASANVYAHVLRDGLLEGSGSDLLLARTDLGHIFPEPAATYVREHGGTVALGAPIRSMSLSNDGFRLDGHDERYAAVIVACAPQHAAPLLLAFPALDSARHAMQRLEFQPIVTCYVQYEGDVSLPCPMMGLTGGMVQWLFDRGQLGGPRALLAAVISASGPHDDLSNDVLLSRVDTELKAATGRHAGIRWARVIREKRATFSCTPGLSRPAAETPVAGLLLAGDYVASDYPGTLESAVRSGITAARNAMRVVGR